MSDLVGNPEDRFSHVEAHKVCKDREAQWRSGRVQDSRV